MGTNQTKWDAHPAVRTGRQLTLGERAADKMRNGMGSWGFVFAAIGFLVAWMFYNGHVGFDPYPFILLNLLLSCVAALQGAILLIAAKRQDQISSELAEHDYENNELALKIVTAVLKHSVESRKKLDTIEAKVDKILSLHEERNDDS